MAHLAEHRRAVNQLAVAGSGAFFVSASNDETVKVWDCRRLEKDVSFRSRLTYASQVGTGSGRKQGLSHPGSGSCHGADNEASVHSCNALLQSCRLPMLH